MFSWSQLSFQDATSPVMEEFIYFHDFTMTVLAFVVTLVVCMMGLTLTNSFINKGLLEGQMLECIWTLLPALVLMQIAVPSLILLYLMEDNVSTDFSIKVIGHQWYWEYEYPDFQAQACSMSFNSYMIKDSEALNAFRLLDTDNRVVLPFASTIQAFVTSEDVLHCWTLPSFGVKIDAAPGRLNQISFSSYRSGLFFGQCSEICGANHSFMPISVEMVSIKDFLAWVSAMGD